MDSDSRGCATIHEEIADLVRSKYSAGTPKRSVPVEINLNWQIAQCIRDELDDDLKVLGKLLTITGSETHECARRLHEYLEDTWPKHGILIWDLLLIAWRNPAHQSASGDISVKLSVDGDERALVTADSEDVDRLIAIVQSLAWLAVTLRPYAR